MNEQRQIIGFVEISLREAPDKIKSEKIGYLEGWFVEKQYRKTGIGKALLDAAEDWAQQKGCAELFSDAELENKISQAAHLALGFKEIDRLVLFKKILKE